MTAVTPVTPARRWPIILTIVLALGVGLTVDRVARPKARASADVAPARGMPVAAPANALASSWFCAGGTAEPDGAADVSVVVANPGRRELTGTVTISPSAGDGRTVPLTVAGRDRAVVHVQDLLQAPYVGVVVTLDGGDVTVEQLVTGPAGTAAAPCASGASDHWYVASGSTARDDTMLLALYNPFPENAIADMSFATDQGRAVPSDFQGVVVPGGGLKVVSVGDHVRRRDAVAATLSARSGRLVVYRLQIRGGATNSLSLALAAPGAAQRWLFAEGNIVDGVTEHFIVYNPGRRESKVTLELALAEGAAEPFELTVPPGETVVVKAEAEERIPHGIAHAVTVTVDSGPSVIVERELTSGPPSARNGSSTSLGATRVAKRWVLAVGASNASYDEWVTVKNTTSREVRFSVVALVDGQRLAVQDLQNIKLGAGRHQTVRLGDHIGRDELSLLVEASGDVVVDRGLYRVDGPGVSVTPGIPLR